MRSALAFSGEPGSFREYEERWANHYARQYGIRPALVRAVIHVESAWNPRAVSPRGALGLMQLMPETCSRFGVAHPFSVDENVRAGVAYLAELENLFDGDVRLVLAAYNAGEKPILARGLSYSSAQVYVYVRLVLQRYRTELLREGGDG